jgi:hypothetical protein
MYDSIYMYKWKPYGDHGSEWVNREIKLITGEGFPFKKKLVQFRIFTFYYLFSKSNEVKSSYFCELEGMKRCLEELGGDYISTLITDR